MQISRIQDTTQLNCPPCPTCLEGNRHFHEIPPPICLKEGIWICLECGTEYTLDKSSTQDGSDSKNDSDPKNSDTKVLERLPPDVFMG